MRRDSVGKRGVRCSSVRSLRLLAVMIIVSFLFIGCPEVKPAKYASPKTGTQRMPQQNIDPPPDPEFEVSPLIQSKPPIDTTPVPEPEGGKLGLPGLIDVALRNNPTTRIAWEQAKASAANWGISRSSYYPQVDGTVEGMGGKIPALQGGRQYVAVGAALSYLLLDFGERSAGAEAARQSLIAANWNHNQAIQDLLRDVPQAYYDHLAAKSTLSASYKNLREAQTTLNATQERQKAGVSTISDVYKAQAQKSQVELDVASNKGDVKISKGNLATVVGWNANSPFEVVKRFDNPPLHKLKMSVNELVEDAKSTRPDIGRAFAEMRGKAAEVKKARALPFPKLTGTGNLAWQRMRRVDSTGYYGGLTLSVPIFHGFEMQNSIRAARAEFEASRAALKLARERVIQEVWNAFYNYKTSAEQLRSSRTFLRSATESYNASFARYKVGAADIVELLNAQSTLADARAQVIDSKKGLYNSYLELLHAVGDRVSEVSDGSYAHAIEERDVTYAQEKEKVE